MEQNSARYNRRDPTVTQPAAPTLPGVKSSEVDLSLADVPWIITWLVVLTILKNISQWEGLSHIIMMENKKCLNHQTVIV